MEEKKYSLILGSNSPRRKELLKMAFIPFTVRATENIPEDFPETMPANDVPLYLAGRKQLFYEQFWSKKEYVVLTCDTVVVLENKVVNKPLNRIDAIEMLTGLSGKMHDVVSGVVLKSFDREVAFNSITKVFFKDVKPEYIKYYVDNFHPYDKAGAYGIQEWIGLIGIERLEGSYFNVMGLPIDLVHEKLNETWPGILL